VAAAWAVMHHLGEAGYIRAAKRIMDAKARLMAGITATQAFDILTPSPHAIFVFRPKEAALDTGRIAAAMDARGWLPGRMADGRALHMHLNPIHDTVVEDYLRHLSESVGEAREGLRESAAVGRVY